MISFLSALLSSRFGAEIWIRFLRLTADTTEIINRVVGHATRI